MRISKFFGSAVLGAASVILLGVSPAFAGTAKIGEAAPNFTLKDETGTSHSLQDFKGKTVVLEWFNPECPFVKKHYGGGNMQKLQKTITDGGGVWLTISSNAEGKQGHLTAASATETRKQLEIKSTAILLDADGTVGKMYAARTTPHMFVIDPAGKLAYDGAIDDNPSTDADDIPKSTNYVLAAFEALKAGKPVATASTEPYGCGVKYQG